MASVEMQTVASVDVLPTLVGVAKNSAVAAVAQSGAEMERLLQELNARYGDDRKHKDEIITITSEHHVVQGRAARYVKDMKEFATAALEQYLPAFKEALNEGSFKIANRMLADLSAHFDQVAQSFGEIVAKYEVVARCVVEPPDGGAGGLASSGAVTSCCGAAVRRCWDMAIWGISFAAACVAALARCCWARCRGTRAVASRTSQQVDQQADQPTNRQTVLGGCADGLRKVKDKLLAVWPFRSTGERAAQQTMFGCFSDGMREVTSIMSEHNEKLLAIQSSLKALTADASKLRHLLEDWREGNDEAARAELKAQMQLASSAFKALQESCHSLERADGQGMLRAKQE